MKYGILSNAASIMMFHNHPSGSTQASREDIEVTKKLIEAGKIMNIPVLDHIIVAGGTAEHFSFKEHNPEMFDVKEKARYMIRDDARVSVKEKIAEKKAVITERDKKITKNEKIPRHAVSDISYT